MNSELESILLDDAITPLALLPLTEDEQVLRRNVVYIRRYYCVIGGLMYRMLYVHM